MKSTRFALGTILAMDSHAAVDFRDKERKQGKAVTRADFPPAKVLQSLKKDRTEKRGTSTKLGLGWLILCALSLILFPAALLAQNFAYVTNFASNSVSVIDTSSNTVAATVSLPGAFGVNSEPWAIAVTPDGSRAYVTNSVGKSVYVIDTTTNTVVATIALPDGSTAIAITPDGSRVYIGTYTSNSVWVIDTSSNTIVADVPVQGSTFLGLAITPDGTRAYYASGQSVSVIDTSSNTVIATVAVGSFAFGVAISPNGARAYVTNLGSQSVSVIDTSSNTVVATVALGDGPFGVAISPDGTRAYVTSRDSNAVNVIDTSSNEVIATITEVSGPYGITVSQDGTRVYAVNDYSNSVSVIDTTSNAVVAMIGVGRSPVVLALKPGKTNQPPIARVGGDQTVECTGHNCATVTLNGSASSDPDGDALTFSWTDPANHVVGTAAIATVTAPLGTTAYTLTVTDPGGLSSSATTHITVQDTTPPVLALPISITVDASSPAGATVTYAVTATDICDPNPSVTCAPVSGGTFPAGTTTVNCTAKDASGNAATGSFSVTVNGAAAQVSNLVLVVNGLDFSQGVQTSLDAKLQAAQAALAAARANDMVTACNQINAFINYAAAQSGKQITVAQANQLIAAGLQIKATLGCP